MIYILLCSIITGILSWTGRNKILSFISTIVFIPYMAAAITAFAHGADLESLQKFGILRTIQAIQNSPAANRSAGLDQPGNIILYYRFGCRDCEDIYNSLKTEVAGKEDIYWVASRQSNGQKLLEKYAIAGVPAGVVILYEDMYISYVLCNFIYDQSAENGGVQLDTYALNRLLKVQNEISMEDRRSLQETAQNFKERNDEYEIR